MANVSYLRLCRVVVVAGLSIGVINTLTARDTGDRTESIAGIDDDSNDPIAKLRRENALLQAKVAVLEEKAAVDQKHIAGLQRLLDEFAARSKQVADRFQKEFEHLKSTIDDREDRIVRSQKKLKDLMDVALSLERDLKHSQERNGILLERVQELEVRLGGGAGKRQADPVANPPTAKLRGKVTAFDTESKRITVSLGSADKLAKGNTLEVFRIEPKAEYVGMLKIDEVGENTAYGKLLDLPGVRNGQVRVGDQVISDLGNRAR